MFCMYYLIFSHKTLGASITPNAEADIWKMRLPKVTQQIKSKARIETRVQLKPRTLTTVIVENKLLVTGTHVHNQNLLCVGKDIRFLDWEAGK